MRHLVIAGLTGNLTAADLLHHPRLKPLHPHIEAGFSTEQSAAKNQELRHRHHCRARDLAVWRYEEKAHHTDDRTGTEAGDGHCALEAGELVFLLGGHDAGWLIVAYQEGEDERIVSCIFESSCPCRAGEYTILNVRLADAVHGRVVLVTAAAEGYVSCDTRR